MIKSDSSTENQNYGSKITSILWLTILFYCFLVNSELVNAVATGNLKDVQNLLQQKKIIPHGIIDETENTLLHLVFQALIYLLVNNLGGET